MIQQTIGISWKKEKIVEHDPPSLKDHKGLSEDFKSFVDICLKKKPEDRPTAKELLAHPFLKKLELYKAASVTLVARGQNARYVERAL
mmetsp:Transcript_24729/g.43975  ORF Transcript_24729/g.43975 Transcript_24729/m.43975 type:complete len:88 (-) Transcript_24729:195-458(-)